MGERDFVRVGQALKPVGLRGELKVLPHTERPENFLGFRRLFLGAEGGERREYRVSRARLSGGAVVLTLAGCADRNAAEALRGQSLWLATDDLPEAEPGAHYLHELMGKTAYRETEPLGRIEAVLDSPAHPLLVVRGEGREWLIPAVRAFIAEVGAESVRFELPPGLLEINADIEAET